MAVNRWQGLNEAMTKGGKVDLRCGSASAGIGRGKEKGQMQIIDDVGVCLWSVVFVFTLELLSVWWVAMSDE